ncbi:hypothetical protein [Vulcanococcus sp.]|uniref:hypothetical protein n=1 Tax=Vulcanococcus sp. TaxID=2856995 RepID=UPI003C10EF82
MTAVLEPAHKLLVCLAVATRARDPVLVAQVAQRADLLLSDREARRAFSRLPSYGVSAADMDWLKAADL